MKTMLLSLIILALSASNINIDVTFPYVRDQKKQSVHNEGEYLLQMNMIKKQQKSTKGTVLLTCHASYPSIVYEQGQEQHDKIMQINQEIKQDAIERFQAACSEATDFINEFMGEIGEGNDRNLLPFIIDLSYEMKWNKEDLISFVYTDYRWLGGAHPDTTKRGFIYDVNKGKKITPIDLLTISEKEIKQFIYDEMRENYQRSPEAYFKEEIEGLKTLDFKYEYYLDQEGLVFFFNTYEVAPYATGIVSIPFKYKDHSVSFRDSELFKN